MAHVDLAKAEAGAIAGQVGRVAALGALAFALVIFAVFLLVIGVSLFLGEWLLGSIGWGVLHGFLFFVSVAMACVLLAIGVVRRPDRPRARARRVVVGIVVGVVLGPRPAQPGLHDHRRQRPDLAVDPGVRPLVVGMLARSASSA